MPRKSKKQSPDSPDPVEEVVRLIQSLTRQQKAELLRRVSELQTVEPETMDISVDQTEAIGYFQEKVATLPGGHRPMQDDDLFLRGLTVAEFFALPGPEQARLWREAHRAIRPARHTERLVQSDAQPSESYLCGVDVLHYALSGLRAGSRGRLAVPEASVLSFWRAAARRNAKLFISPASNHLLKSLDRYTETRLLLTSVYTLYPARYYSRWSQRIHEITSLPTDTAVLIALATFGTEATANILGVHQLITFDQSLIASYTQARARLQSRLQLMTTRLSVPYRRAVLPEIILPAAKFK